MGYVIRRGCEDVQSWVRHDLKYQAGLDAIVAPVVMHGTTVGYQARFIEPKDPKFRMKTSTDLPRDRVLLGYDPARELNAVIVVEGIFDWLKTDCPHLGVGSVATMGKVLNLGQIELLKRLPAQKLYIGLDRDAFDLLPSLYRELCAHKEVFRILPPEHRKDFGECSTAEVEFSLTQAVSVGPTKLGRLELSLA